MTKEDPKEFEKDPKMIEEEPKEDPIEDPIKNLEAVPPEIALNESRLKGIILATALVSGFSGVKSSTLRKIEALTRDREREIVQVAESVNELVQIMKDLSVLVIDQETIVDRIDYNVQNVASLVEDDFKQLEKVLSLIVFFVL
ncbi:syntaxin-43-like [Zingiber officinale]|uniref:syntaxin-43-like n=1 Tax=Zingiber officinale TaxID=94328 RepID=UPI001C4B5503|nr:syntaxin-43-like [Zingiber officinale]